MFCTGLETPTLMFLEHVNQNPGEPAARNISYASPRSSFTVPVPQLGHRESAGAKNNNKRCAPGSVGVRSLPLHYPWLKCATSAVSQSAGIIPGIIPHPRQTTLL